jgi:hypothetical protein
MVVEPEKRLRRHFIHLEAIASDWQKGINLLGNMLRRLVHIRYREAE